MFADSVRLYEFTDGSVFGFALLSNSSGSEISIPNESIDKPKAIVAVFARVPFASIASC